MKKFLCALLTVLLVCVPMSMVAHAETYVDSEYGNYEGQSEFDYHAYSHYFVTIPTHIDADNSGELAVTMDGIEDGYHIEAYVTNLDADGCITVYSQNYDTDNLTTAVGVVYDVGNPNGSKNVTPDGLIGKYYPADHTDGTPATTNIGFTKPMDMNVKPGIYHGVICFRVECVHD